MRPVRIVIFAKAPLPGFAKTRLVATLGAQGAADLAQQMLQQMLEQALAARLCPVELCASPAATDAAWQTFDLPTGLQLSDQVEGDLGERMARAARRVLAGGESILLAGSDCPALDAAHLQQLGWMVFTLAPLHDIDEPDDLQWLATQ